MTINLYKQHQNHEPEHNLKPGIQQLEYESCLFNASEILVRGQGVTEGLAAALFSRSMIKFTDINRTEIWCSGEIVGRS